MENQRQGYIPLYRSILNQPWAKDVYLRTLWDNLLLKAARKPYTASFRGHNWHLESGQLVTTSADLGLSLCDRNGEPTSRHAIERMLAFFEKEGMISVHAERRKGTLITVLNYTEYAQKMDDLPAHNSAHMTAHNEPSNTRASDGGAAHMTAHYSAHHEQEGFNKNINNKNTMSENTRTGCEKTFQPANKNQEADEAFVTVFWCAGMVRTGKQKAMQAFRTQYLSWRKESGGTPEQFARMLADDIASRKGRQFGFDRLHPATYLNGKRWQDEKPAVAPVTSNVKSAITVSKSGYVFIDR